MVCRGCLIARTASNGVTLYDRCVVRRTSSGDLPFFCCALALRYPIDWDWDSGLSCTCTIYGTSYDERSSRCGRTWRLCANAPFICACEDCRASI